MEHNFIIDFTHKLDRKPNNDKKKGEITAISPANVKTTISQHPTKLSIKDFAKYVVQPYGHAFASGLYDGNGSADSNHLGNMSCFILDYDDYITYKDVKKFFSDNGIFLNVVYKSFSYTSEKEKFRVCIFIDRVIEDKQVIQHILNMLFMSIRGATVDARGRTCKNNGIADNCVKTISQMYYPGVELLDDVIETENSWDLFEALLNKVAAEISETAKAAIKTIDSVIQAAKIKPIIEYIPKYDGLATIRNFDFDKLRNIKCFRVLIDCEEKLGHNVLFRMFCTLAFIKGGVAYGYSKILEYNKKFAHTDRELYSDKSSIGNGIKNKAKRGSYYESSRVNTYSPYIEDSDIDVDAIEYILGRKFGYNPVKINHNIPLLSLEEAQDRMEAEFKNWFHNSKKGEITLLKTVTGLGKTEVSIKLAVDCVRTNKGILFAFPTHKLKEEFFERLKVVLTDAEIEAFVKVQPPTPTGQGKLFRDFLNVRASFGFKKSMDFLKNVITTKSQYDYDDRDVSIFRTYYYERQSCWGWSNILLTTHSAVSLIDYKNIDLYVFDEDPLPTYYEQRQYNIASLKSKIESLKHIEITDFTDCLIDVDELSAMKKEQSVKLNAIVYKNLKELIRNIENSQNTPTFFKISDTDQYRCIEKIYHQAFVNANVADFDDIAMFLESSQCCNIIKYKSNYRTDENAFITYSILRDVNIFTSKNTIILSATASANIISKLYNKPVNFIDITNVKKLGITIQITQFSGSQADIKRELFKKTVDNNDDNLIDYVNTNLCELPVITFKNFAKHFKNGCKQMHLGNCSGYDGYNGLDLVVVGKLNFDIYSTALLAATLNFDVSDLSCSELFVNVNNFTTKLFTFNNQTLRELAIYIMNREQVQAEGRSRLLRRPSIVILFSNCPVANHQNTDYMVSSATEGVNLYKKLLKARKLSKTN